MKLFRYFVIAAAVGLALAAFATPARADGCGLFGKGCGGGGHAPSTLFNFGGFNFHKQKLPVFQAAPWYQYWPYDAHFLTPAPIAGPFYGPPLTGNFPVNPFFPNPVGYGPIPGGPPPHQVVPTGR
jgi:hypothetical protein